MFFFEKLPDSHDPSIYGNLESITVFITVTSRYFIVLIHSILTTGP